MWGISSSTLSRHGEMRGFNLGERRFGFGMTTRGIQRSQLASISRHLEEVSLSHPSRLFKGSRVQKTMIDDRLPQRQILVKPSDILAFDLVQGVDVRWSQIMDKSMPEPPTAVLLHGILGSRKNWDLQCHGDSASINNRGPHTVASAALDVLKLLGCLKLTPRVVVGHSFGGKVALSMVEQAAKPLARPIRAS